MKATGIVRRIDDLGRVVIPKEIRRTMRIREGDPLEIFTNNDGEVVFKKYSPMGELGTFAAQYAEVMARALGQAVVVSDRDRIIAVAGAPKKDLLERPVSAMLESAMEQRRPHLARAGEVDLEHGLSLRKVCADVAHTLWDADDDIVARMVVCCGFERRHEGRLDARHGETVHGFGQVEVVVRFRKAAADESCGAVVIADVGIVSVAQRCPVFAIL